MTLPPSSSDNPSLPNPKSASSPTEAKVCPFPIRVVIPLLLLLVGVGYGVWHVRSHLNPNVIVLAAQGSLTQSQSSSLNSDIRTAQIVAPRND